MLSILKPFARKSPAAHSADRRRLRWQVESLEGRDLPAPLIVGTLADAGPGSLRDAITQANANPVFTEIDIEVTGNINIYSPLPALTGKYAIKGPGADQGRIVADNCRVFTIAPGADIEIVGLTLTDGFAPSGEGNIGPHGGDISNAGNLKLESVDVLHGYAVEGGGIYNAGSMSIYDSTLDRNVCYASSGGALGAAYFGDSGSSLYMVNSTVAQNYASGDHAYIGGLLFAAGSQGTLSDCTIAHNYSQYNAAAPNDSYAAGLAVIWAPSRADVQLFNTIVADNYLGDSGTKTHDVWGPLMYTSRFNLIGNGDWAMGIADQNGGNKVGSAGGPFYFTGFGTLGNHGGRVPTLDIQAGSDAIDAGDTEYLPDLPVDARAHKRVVGDQVDIGAYEYQPSSVHVNFTASPAPVAGQPVTLTLTVTPDTPNSNAVNGFVTFYVNSYDTPNFLGRVDVVNGQAVLADVTLPADATLIGAQYEGDDEFGLAVAGELSVAQGPGGGGGVVNPIVADPGGPADPGVPAGGQPANPGGPVVAQPVGSQTSSPHGTITKHGKGHPAPAPKKHAIPRGPVHRGAAHAPLHKPHKGR
jgi:hypothetical protein